MCFTLGKKIIKQGRLLIFKRAHYYIQVTLLNTKNLRETFEIPIPFNTEEYQKEGLMFFDYRIQSLTGKDKDLENKIRQLYIKNAAPSQYYDRILEIKTGNIINK